MNIIKAITICLCSLGVMADVSYAKEWRGIVPLHSTREDVKRLLGPSPEPGEGFYEFENEVAVIQYSNGPCKKGLPGGWNVPRDTVISVDVMPRPALLLAELNIDIKQFKKSVDPKVPSIFYYTDEEDGVTFQVREDRVDAIFYKAAERDKHLRCPSKSIKAPTPNSPIIYLVDKVDEFGEVPLKEEQERLNHLARLLKESPDTQGYVIIYAGRRAQAREGSIRAERAKNYLVNQSGVDPSRITAVDGGHREELTVELWFGSRGAPGPYLSPSVSPSEVHIIKDGKMRNNNCRSSQPRRK